MKLLRSDMIVWWRAGIVAGAIALAIMAFFSFFLYQRVSSFGSQSAAPPVEKRPPLFSPALLDDMKAFWQKRTGGGG